jgi:hypothetical protein
VSKTLKRRGRRQDFLFPSKEDAMTRQERLRKIKRIVKKESYVTEDKLEEAIEQLINSVIFN